ncbi:MAG TPA: PLP-dependent aspartate aminotransferase family protein [Polyangiaceae bacterium]|nr:PLP-dependent aspartate aminotransferase family protein [Polyangiaceae bacterium]
MSSSFAAAAPGEPTTSSHLETLAIHAGQHPDPVHGAVMQPIVLSSTFAQPEPGKPLRFDYSRSGNPTRQALEECLAALEGGKYGFAFGSGCAAATTLLHTLRPGDHVICGDDVYGGTYRLFARVLAPLGIETSFVDLRKSSSLEAALKPATKLIWLETPTNPMLKLADIAQVTAFARARQLLSVVDNTFASPILQSPLRLGADVVLHSTTKYINGHSDVVGGALITSDAALAERLRFLQNAIGAVPSPMDCYLVLRGIKTLPLRMQRHVESATELANRLERAEGVSRVHYPGLASHEQHELAQRQMRGGGGIVTLELAGGLPAASAFLKSLRYFALAESLGGVESLAEHPAIMTHASIPAEIRQASGISDGLVRLSVGLEHIEDLWQDLSRALVAAREARS